LKKCMKSKRLSIFKVRWGETVPIITVGNPVSGPMPVSTKRNEVLYAKKRGVINSSSPANARQEERKEVRLDTVDAINVIDCMAFFNGDDSLELVKYLPTPQMPAPANPLTERYMLIDWCKEVEAEGFTTICL